MAEERLWLTMAEERLWLTMAEERLWLTMAEERRRRVSKPCIASTMA